jgi:hypothetical protein
MKYKAHPLTPEQADRLHYLGLMVGHASHFYMAFPG